MSVAGSAATNYMLDGQSAPSGAYSFRRLLTSYSTNKLVRLVRASDSTQTDIGFTSTGAFDTATATTFCNATTCKVVTIYDQSGNTRDITQGTDANRPALALNCIGTTPCAQMTTGALGLTTGNVTPATGLASLNAVANRAVGTTGACNFLRQNGANNRLGSLSGAANKWIVFGGSSGNFNAAAADATWHSGTAVINGASSVLNIDGTETTGTATGNTTAGGIGTFGAASTTCDVVEGVLWDNTAISTAARAMIKNNQRAWWGF
jgi:hypothetical protein